MHIFLTGATGLLGSAFARAAKRRGHRVTGVVHRTPLPEDVPLDQCLTGDLTDQSWTLQTVLDLFPDAIVNAAAVAQAADCEANPELSQALNVALPTQLAQLAHHFSAKLLHVSTDMVFDGERGNYSPVDEPAPTCLYGWQKLEAEKAVIQRAPDFATVLRLPLLNGNTANGTRSLHERLFAAWIKGEKPGLYREEMRQPCLVDNAAKVMVELCERNDFLGIRHWAGAEPLSRWEIGQKIVRHFNLPEDLIRPVSRRDDPAAQKRPADLTFDITSLKSKLKTRPQPFEDQLDPLIIPPAAREWYHSL